VFGVGYLEWTAKRIAGVFATAESVKFAGPIKLIVKPVAKAISGGIAAFCGKGMLASWLDVALAFVLLFFCLWAITKMMRSLVLNRLESVLDRTLGRSAALGIAVGALFTAIVQSSSITTSIMVPLAASGILTLHQVFPVTVGANIGTTVTALMAALSGSGAGLTIAVVHLLFNLSGTIIFVPLPAMRRIPMGMAEWLAGLSERSRWYSVAYVTVIFFAIPGLLVILT
jgi:sodium-dependent phosphate cotransporter